jgi:hypothetical protein
MAVGRITGPLLKSNLTRGGVNLAFETNLLYLDVVNSRVGINTTSPSNDLQVNGTARTTNLTATGSSTLATFTIGTNVISSTSSTINLTPQGVNPVVYQGTLQAGSLQLATNVISSLGTNTDINVTPIGTGVINLNAPTTVYGNFHATGNITADGAVQLGATYTKTATGTSGQNTIVVSPDNTNLVLGMGVSGTGIGNGAVINNIVGTTVTLSVNNSGAVSGTITFTSQVSVTFSGTVTSNITPSASNTYNLGSATNYWNNLYTYTVNSTTANISNIQLTGNTISTTNTNGDLILAPNGTGGIVASQLRIYQNVISSTQTNQNISFAPQGTGNVVFSGTNALQIPSGTTGQRPTGVAGMIRYNTSLNRYEGYNSTSSVWQGLSGVVDVAGATYITPELTPGAGDNTLRFYTNNSLMVTIDSTKLYTSRLQTSNLDILNNTITTISASTDLNLTTTGTGGVVIGNLKFYNNSITNTSTNAITTFTQTGTGYTKFSGTNGVVLPSGNATTDRPAAYETGMTRFNTDSQYVEVWNGTAWSSVGGSAQGVTQATATDLGILSAIIFG